MGSIHHSWEEDSENETGNVVYEVQLDATDDESTMRAFDQGKIKDDSSIRPITIDDYFAHIDTAPEHNALKYMKRQARGETLLKTKYYELNRVELSGARSQQTKSVWHHIYVQKGAIELVNGETTLHIARGHSCFVPSDINEYTIASGDAVILITHLPRV